jgi:hypothetical protein
VTLEDEVKDKVARLLALVCNENTDPESYEFVLKKLTRMSILGTLPPGSRPAPAPDKGTYEVADDSALKERWIAP